MISTSLAFKTLTILGVWFPNNNNNFGKFRKYVYNFYTFLVTINYYLFVILLTITAITENDKEKIIETFLLIATTFFLLWKLNNLLLNKNGIINLDTKLYHDLFIPTSEDELSVERNCKKIMKKIVILFSFLGCSVSIFYCIYPLMSEEMYLLPANQWFPFEINSSNYKVVYVWQVFNFIHGAFLQCCSDCIFVEFISYGCVQFSILTKRLKKISAIIASTKKSNMSKQDIRNIERKILRNPFEHHQLIFE